MLLVPYRTLAAAGRAPKTRDNETKNQCCTHQGSQRHSSDTAAIAVARARSTDCAYHTQHQTAVITARRRREAIRVARLRKTSRRCRRRGASPPSYNRRSAPRRGRRHYSKPRRSTARNYKIGPATASLQKGAPRSSASTRSRSARNELQESTREFHKTTSRRALNLEASRV